MERRTEHTNASARPRWPRGYQWLEPHPHRTLAKAVFTEYIFTAFFLFFVTGAITSGCHTPDTAAQTLGVGDRRDGYLADIDVTLTKAAPGSCFLGSTNLTNIAFSFGFAIFVLVYAAASFSGGHLNPAVTVGFFIARKISLVRGLLYIIFQCLGACTGSALIKAIDVNGFRAANGGANALNVGVSSVSAWGVETILTAALMFMVFAATDADRTSKAAHLPILAPLAIGVTVFLAHLVAIPIDGCSINPARSFGAAATSHMWAHQWIFWVGPIGGAVAAAAVYEVVFRTPDDEEVVYAPQDMEAGVSPQVMPPYTGVAGMKEVVHYNEDAVVTASQVAKGAHVVQAADIDAKA